MSVLKLAIHEDVWMAKSIWPRKPGSFDDPAKGSRNVNSTRYAVI